MKARTIARFEPQVHITDEAWDDMMHITQLVDKEIGWLAVVERDNNLFTIKDVHLPTQQSSGATVEMEPEFLHTFAEELMATLGDEAFAQLNDSLRCWGHSHGSGGVSPSSQDQSTIEKLIDNCDFFVALRTNRSGSVQADVALAARGIVYEDVKVTIGSIDTERRAHWEGLVKERVREMPRTVYSSNQNWNSWDRGDNWRQKGGKEKGKGNAGTYDGEVLLPLAEAKGVWGTNAPAEAILEINRLKNLSVSARRDRLSNWWRACERVWGKTTDDYETAIFMKDDREAAYQLDLLIRATYAALPDAEVERVALIISNSYYRDFDGLLLAGWMPTVAWEPLLRSYQEAVKAQKEAEANLAIDKTLTS